METEEPRTDPNPEAELADLLHRLARALRLEEAASLLAMSHDFVYRHWKRLGGYKDTDHHIKFRMSDIQRHLQRKAKGGRSCG